MTKFLYLIVWMYCWASALSCCLKILVDKKDNASVAINNNPIDIVILFVLCNCAASNLKLVIEVSLVKLHPKLVIMTSEFNLSHSLV
jgi:hypothetical protein